MALNSVSPINYREHWQRAEPVDAAFSRFAIESGVLPGPFGLLFFGLLEFGNAWLELAQNRQFDPTQAAEKLKEKTNEIRGKPARIESEFWQLLSQQINSGDKLAIGYRRYSGNRQELRLVWDGPIQFSSFDLANRGYSGPNFQFSGIRILDRTQCEQQLLAKSDRLRDGKKGRPQFASIRIAIDRVFLRNPDLDNPELIKRASGEIVDEIFEMRVAGLTAEKPEESTIQSALRRRWKQKEMQSSHALAETQRPRGA
jgi:hypothetical protein